jgi:PAS domain S-box-containing protein
VTNSQSNAALRQRAENFLRQTRDDISRMDAEDVQRLVRELQIHQIELKMQNEALLQTQDDLEKSRQEYQDLYDFAPVGYLMLDRSGCIVRANVKALEILNSPFERISGRKFLEFVHSSSQEIYLKYFAESLRAHDALKCELELVGTGTCLQLNSQVDDNREFCLMSLNDITDIKKLERDLVRMNARAEAASVAKSEFLASMSHEIRTPLNAIIGLSQLLSSSRPLTDKQKKFVDTLRVGANNLLSLIDGLLNFSKIEAGIVDVVNVPFHLPTLLKEVSDIVSLNADANKLQITVEDYCGIKDFIGDKDKIGQILTNLCTNAVKFTPEGSIRLVAELGPLAEDGYQDVQIKVIDTGIGIPPEKIDKVFQKFVQADSSISRRYGGTGLGLAIVDNLTFKLGGTVFVESEVGQGSTFKISIPLRRALSADVVEHDLPDKSPVAKEVEAVLIVEDYEPNILVTTCLLEEMGYSYDVATSGILALEKFSRQKYSAIIMDVQMPDMDGIEATQKIRKLEKEKNLSPIPILAMTGNATSGDRELCYKAGMNDYLSKPFQKSDLENKLLVLCARSH